MNEIEGEIIEFDGTMEMADKLGLWSIKDEDGNPLKFILPLGSADFKLINKGDKLRMVKDE